jgi:hypothetical protein
MQFVDRREQLGRIHARQVIGASDQQTTLGDEVVDESAIRLLGLVVVRIVDVGERDEEGPVQQI